MIHPTRRRFLRDCSLAAAAASLAPAAVMARPRPVRPGVREPLRFEHFAAQIGTFFRLGESRPSLQVQLATATRLPPAPPQAEDARNERFCLSFRGPAGEPLAQDTYPFEHERLGRLYIFIVPGPTLEPALYREYTAVFNYPLRPADAAAQLARAPLPGPRATAAL